jgi:hypothetical protein
MKFGTLTFLTTEVLFGVPASMLPGRAPAACKAQIRAKECRETRTLPAIS